MGREGVQTTDFDHANALTAPAGFSFAPVSLEWASGSSSFRGCVPRVASR